MPKKLLTIFGATGNQGGSVIAAILSHPELSSTYTLRAITRDPSKPNALALSKQGVQLAKADLNDPSSIATAISSSHGVFAVTNYWETQSKTIEYQQGVNIVDACVQGGVKHLVWSALPHATQISNGTLRKIEHFDSKAEVREYAERTKKGMVVSYFMPGYFMSNLVTQIKPITENDNNTDTDSETYAISLPWSPQQTWVPTLDIRTDTGFYIAGLFNAGPKANGISIQGVSEWLHPSTLTTEITRATGKKVIFKETQMTVAIADTLPKITAEIMENMLLIRDYSYFGVGAEGRQGESDRFFLEGVEKRTFREFAEKADWKL